MYPFGILVSLCSLHAHTCNSPVYISLQGLKAPIAESKCLHVVIYSDFVSAETPSSFHREEEAPISAQKALGFSQSTAVTFHPCHSITPAKQSEHSMP